MYNDEPTVFTPQQVAGMFFSKMRDLVQVSTGLKGCDMVLSVPPYYTDSQRHAVLDACKIGSVKCLGLVNENVAVALAYGMYRSAKGEFDLTSETVTMFVDMGDAAFTYVASAGPATAEVVAQLHVCQCRE